MKEMFKNTINFIGQNLGNNNIMINFFKDAIKNKKKIIVDGNEFEVVDPNNVTFDRYGEANCLIKINGTTAKCNIQTSNEASGANINIKKIIKNEEEENGTKPKIELKINGKSIKASDFFTINSDFSISTMQRLNVIYSDPTINENNNNNNRVYLPLSGVDAIQNMNFYDFDKKKQKITGKKNSVSLKVKYDQLKSSYDQLKKSSLDNKQDETYKDLIKQIKTEISDDYEPFYLTFKETSQQTDENKNKINNNDKNKNKINNNDDKIEDNVDIVCCSTRTKIIFFKKNPQTKKFVKIKSISKQTPYYSAAFINGDLVYSLDKSRGVLEIYSLKYMEKISAIELSTNLRKDNYLMSRLNLKELTFMDKKTFEEQLKTYMAEKCVINTINNNKADVNGKSTQQKNCNIY